VPKMRFKWAKMNGIWTAQEAQLAMRERNWLKLRFMLTGIEYSIIMREKW
jgi:hypothetical protein